MLSHQQVVVLLSRRLQGSGGLKARPEPNQRIAKTIQVMQDWGASSLLSGLENSFPNEPPFGYYHISDPGLAMDHKGGWITVVVVFKFENTDSLFSSKWLRNLPTLSLPSNRIFEFLPANRNHRIPRLALRHNDAKLVPRRRQIVIRLITQTDLYSTPPNTISNQTLPTAKLT